MTEKQKGSIMDLQVYSDAYKGAYGIRPTTFPQTENEYFEAMTAIAQKIEDDENNRRRIEAQAWSLWQKSVYGLMTMTNEGYSTAVRWLMEAEGLDYLNEEHRQQYLYDSGLSPRRYEQVFSQWN